MKILEKIPLTLAHWQSSPMLVYLRINLRKISLLACLTHLMYRYRFPAFVVIIYVRGEPGDEYIGKLMTVCHAREHGT